jgi:hypothetical protein
MTTLTTPPPALDRVDTPDDPEAYLHDHRDAGGCRYERFGVSVDQYSHFRRWGYLVVPGLLTPEDVDELQQHTEDLMQGQLPEQLAMEEFDPTGEHGNSNTHRGEDDTVRHLFRPPAHYSPEEKAQFFLRIHMLHRQLALHERYLLHPRVLDVLEAILGPDVSALQSMLFLKPPGRVGQGWHQDSYYIPTTPDTLCGAWLAIDDADEYNGGLWMAKGSGAEPVYPPCPADAEKIVYGFGDKQLQSIKHIRGASEPDDSNNLLTPVAEKYDQVLVPVKKGDVVFFNGHILHRSKDNITEDRYRRAFVGHYFNARSFTQWNPDQNNPAGKDEATGGSNGSHILARGDTHLPFAKPRFGTPCASLLSADQRRGNQEHVERVMAAHGDGLMGCSIADPYLRDD